MDAGADVFELQRQFGVCNRGGNQFDVNVIAKRLDRVWRKRKLAFKMGMIVHAEVIEAAARTGACQTVQQRLRKRDAFSLDLQGQLAIVPLPLALDLNLSCDSGAGSAID